MSVNGETRKKEKLDPLPNDKDEFWDEAEKEICTLKEVTCLKKEHEFIQTKAMEAKCTKCPIGYILAPGWYVENKHIYTVNKELVV